MTVYTKDNRNKNLKENKKKFPMPGSVNWLPEWLMNL